MFQFRRVFLLPDLNSIFVKTIFIGIFISAIGQLFQLNPTIMGRTSGSPFRIIRVYNFAYTTSRGTTFSWNYLAALKVKIIKTISIGIVPSIFALNISLTWIWFGCAAHISVRFLSEFFPVKWTSSIFMDAIWFIIGIFFYWNWHRWPKISIANFITLSPKS